MRAALPQGYMPERSDSGAIAVKICGSYDVHLIPLKHGSDPAKQRQNAEPPCAFAGLASPGLPPALELDLPPRKIARANFGTPAVAQPPLATPRFLPPARGPPVSA